MDLSEKSRLEKLLGMLGSSFDGERANAARMIAAMADKKKLTITELIYGAAGARPQSAPRQPPPPPPKQKAKERPFGAKNSNTMLQQLADIAADSDEFEFVLTEWECQFASDVASRYSYDYELSEKQIVIVEKILRKVEISRAAATG